MTARLILAPLLLHSNYDVDDHYQHVHVVVRTRRKYMHNAVVGMVGGLGYDGQLKCNICDTCRPYHWILSILKPVFLPNSTYLLCLQVAQMPSTTIEPITLPLHMHTG